MSYTIEKSQSQVLLSIQDELTAADVSRFRDALLAAALGPLPVVLDAKDAKRIDLSVVQVLVAVQKTAGKLTVQDCSAGIRSYLGRAGVCIDPWAGQSPPDGAWANGKGNG